MGLITKGSNGKGLATTGIVRDSRQAGSSILELQSTKNFVENNELFHFAQWTTDTVNKPVSIEQQAALDEKVNKATGNSVVYATDDGGVDKHIPYSDDIVAGTIAVRSNNGTLRGATPVASDDLVNKAHLDSELANKVDSVNGKTGEVSVLEVPEGGATGQVVKKTASGYAWGADNNTQYEEIPTEEIDGGTNTTKRTITGRRTKYIIDKAQTGVVKTTGNQAIAGDLDVEGDIYSNGKNLVDMFYPIGSTYFNKTNSTNPATLLGFGTWARLESVVLGGRSETGGSPFNVTAGTVIGADTHKLTIAQMPSHQHNFKGGRASIAAASDGIGLMGGTGSDGYGNWGSIVQGTGGGQAHNNIQRTLVGYLWERTA